MRHSDVALPSVLTTRYYIPQEWQTVLHQICSTTDPFDLRCESVTLSFRHKADKLAKTGCNNKLRYTTEFPWKSPIYQGLRMAISVAMM